jgi:hypothetical protein
MIPGAAINPPNISRGASSSSTPAGAERPILHQSLDAQAQAIEHLHDFINRLEGRLDCVLAYDDTPGNPASTSPPAPIRPTDRLQWHVQLIEQAAARIGALTRRLEL